MSRKKSKFKLFGKPISFEREGDHTLITWSSLNGTDILLLFLAVMMGIWGIGSALGWEEFNEVRILPMNTIQTAIFWSIIILILVHLLFNCKARLRIDKHEIIFQKRQLIPIIHKHAVRNIDAIYIKEKGNFYESDTAFYPTIYKVYIQLLNGKSRKLGSFNEENTQALKNEIQKFIAMRE